MAHIDAGKTTFTERLLFYTGRVRNVGEVHNGTAVMDWMPQEQERGITITSAATTTKWTTSMLGEVQFNIIDTPGHIDFTVEVERSLRIIDGAIIILDASAGVEPQTEMIWRQANKYFIPRLIFCNKMDKTGANYYTSINSVLSKLSITPLILQIPIGHDKDFIGIVDIVNMNAIYWNLDSKGINWNITDIPDEFIDLANKQRNILINAIADLDQKALNAYLNTELLTNKSIAALTRLATLSGKAFPVMCGSAFKNKAIQPILDAIVNYLPSPDDIRPIEDAFAKHNQLLKFPNCSESLAMLIFKITSDAYLGGLNYARIYSGTLKLGEVLYNPRNGSKDKVIKILKMHANFRTELNIAKSGDIIAISGLKLTITGDTLCDISSPITLYSIEFPMPVIQMAIEPYTKVDQEKVTVILDKYCLEDPTLDYKIDNESGQVILSGMGELHLDVVIDRIHREHNLILKTNKPQVAYRETINSKCTEEYTHKKQSGGAGQFAKVKILFEPNDKDEFTFISKIVGGSIPKEYIPGVKRGLESAIACGPALGYPVIRLKATLLDGCYHDVDSSILAFEIAAKSCFKRAIQNIGINVLEPIMKVEINIPDEYIGNVICDLNSRKGHIINQNSLMEFTTIIANIPLANMFKYVDTLRSLSKGRGSYFMSFYNYSEISNKIR